MHSPEQQPEIDVLLHLQHGLEQQLARVQGRLAILLATEVDDGEPMFFEKEPAPVRHLHLVRGDNPDGAA